MNGKFNVSKEFFCALLSVKLIILGFGMYIDSSFICIFPWYNPGDWAIVGLLLWPFDIAISIFLFAAGKSHNILSGFTRVLIITPVIFLVVMLIASDYIMRLGTNSLLYRLSNELSSYWGMTLKVITCISILYDTRKRFKAPRNE